MRIIAIIIGIISAHLLVYDSPSSFNFAMGSLFTMFIFSVADMIKRIKIIKHKEDV